MKRTLAAVFSQAKTQALARLRSFASKSDFIAQLQVAFGGNFDNNIALGIASQLQSGDFSLIPEIQVLTNGELSTANGAYAAELDRIFISSDFLVQHQNDINAIAELLLEEIGHKFDRLLNGSVDSPGDEGAIFRSLVKGQTLSPTMLSGLRATDDTAVIIINGQSVAVEKQDFNGTSGNDILIGTGGDDQFYPGTGADTINGGAGNDYLGIYNYTDTANTTIIYTSTTSGTITGGSNNGTTFQNIERVLFFTGYGADNINISAATGSGLVDGGGGNDTITGSANSDGLYGGIGNDSINGGAGDDNIRGGGGDDTLNGGNGNDAIIVGVFSAEFNGGAEKIDGGAGDDSLSIIASDSSSDTIISYTSAIGTITGGSNNGTTFQNIERVYCDTGSGADNINISAATGSSNVRAGGGNDTIIGSANADSLVGDAGNDNLNGGAGNDTLNGGTGNDTLNGGNGNDTLVVDNIGDVVVENANEGTDTIESSISYALTTNVENLVLTGTSNINGTGSNLNNTITGNNSDNNLDGGAGNDTLNGGAGNDTYTFNVDTAQGSDVIAEVTGAGNDTISFIGNTSVTLDLNTTTSQSVNANLVLTVTKFNVENISGGSGADTLRGNGAANIFAGGAGNDTMNGGAGNDTMNGGAGNDLFVFGGANLTNLVVMGVDTIGDFTSKVDRLVLSKLAFGNLTTASGNPLLASDFASVTSDISAGTSNAAIVYNRSNGKLFYNANLSGVGGPFGGSSPFGSDGGQFVQLAAGLKLSSSDFDVVS
jgi:Ca2+-binding RTX toxin-like protein